MADFCKQCSMDIFGEDFGDLAKLCTKKENEQGLYAIVVCEGCGTTLVDNEGRCVSSDCLRKHSESKEDTQ